MLGREREWGRGGGGIWSVEDEAGGGGSLPALAEVGSAILGGVACKRCVLLSSMLESGRMHCRMRVDAVREVKLGVRLVGTTRDEAEVIYAMR